MEYLSISRIIYKSKAKYEKSFLYTESDGNDLGYFITYNLEVLEKAFEGLKKYRGSGVIPWQSYPKMIDKRYMKNGRSDTPCS